jgi:AraC family transcriptional regulator, regulatory protein of adaptative response / DNA-3-methyladenine glycosylase II
MVFYPSAAAAQQAGFRACKRCRPDATPGSPEWNGRADVVARAVRLIADGVVEREGVDGLARRLAYSTRQIERHLQAELGAGPLAIARAQRVQIARTLIETTSLPMNEVSDGSGFATVRSFNDTVKQVFAMSPTQLRTNAQKRKAVSTPGEIALRLPFRKPLNPDNLFGHLAATAIPGVEQWRDGWYRRTLRLPNGNGIVALQPKPEYVACRLRLKDMRDLSTAINRCRWLLDLDADPISIDEHLSTDPHLSPLVAIAPGRRVPRTVDPNEYAIRAVLGQQVSTAAARTHASRLVFAHGDPIEDTEGGLTHVFPEASQLVDIDSDALAMPNSRKRTLLMLVNALASGEVCLDPGTDWNVAREQLTALPGIGPWTTEAIAMRALGDPDAFLATDLGVIKAAAHLGLPSKPTALQEASKAWRPWRAYAVQHLWATTEHAVNHMPTTIEKESA